MEGGKPEKLEKNPWCKKANYQQTQPTYIARFKNGTQATLVLGERSHSTISSPYLSFFETAVEASTIQGSALLCTIQIKFEIITWAWQEVYCMVFYDELKPQVT